MDPTATAALALVQDALLTPQERIRIFLESLPVLGKENMDLEEPCPICLMPFASVFAEEEEITARKERENEGDQGKLGVTKLVGCGHTFCRRDLTEWIKSQHGSCPTCRHTFLNIRPPSESDDESSDGGEYIPNSEDLEDDDEILDADAYTDTEGEDFVVHGMELDIDDLWESHTRDSEREQQVDQDADEEMDDDEDYEYSSEWGLTDGESESMTSSISEGDMNMENAANNDEEDRINVVLETEVNVSVHEDDEDLNVDEEQGLIPHEIVSDSQEYK